MALPSRRRLRLERLNAEAMQRQCAVVLVEDARGKMTSSSTSQTLRLFLIDQLLRLLHRRGLAESL